MNTPILAVSLLLSLCALRAVCQVAPYRYGATVLRDSCPLEINVTSRAMEPAMATVLSNIAAGIASGTGRCLEKIYVMAYTSGRRSSDTHHPHEIEVIGAGQTRRITLPDRPDDYTQHKGDIWKLGIIEDLGFLPGTCLRLCNIQNVTIAEGGNNAWNIDSIVTYGCIDGVGCSPLTQDIDVFRWVDGNFNEESLRFPLTKVSQSLCI